MFEVCDSISAMVESKKRYLLYRCTCMWSCIPTEILSGGCVLHHNRNQAHIDTRGAHKTHTDFLEDAPPCINPYIGAHSEKHVVRVEGAGLHAYVV
jgi:hypothetical protein